MNCEAVIIFSVPLIIVLCTIHYFISRFETQKLNQSIKKSIANVWSPHGGGTQTTEVASLANKLVEKMNSNTSIIDSFGLATMILTALVTTIYALSQIDNQICKVETPNTNPSIIESSQEDAAV